MISRARSRGAILALAALGATEASLSAREAAPLRPAAPFAERELSERGILIVRLDPRFGATPGACDALSARDLAVTVDGVAAQVNTVERVPRPDRHWLLLDISGSAEGRRQEAMRSAREYLRRVMTPEVDSAAVLTADDDTILVAGPSTDPSALDAGIASIPPGQGSALRDALATVLRQVAGDRHEHLVLFWTDGQDTQSMTGNDELLAELARAPNATVFPLALMPTLDPRSNRGPIGSFLFDVARRSGSEVFASNDPRWLDRVRGWIARRFTVAFTPPRGAVRGKVRVGVPGRRCEATILPDPFGRPDPIAGEAPPAPPSWVRIHARQRRNDDEACAALPADAPWDRPLTASDRRLSGCVLDAVAAVGPVVRGTEKHLSLEVTEARFAARDVRILAPPVAELPHDLVEAIPSLLRQPDREAGARSSLMIEGGALLAQRARIAASLFAARRDYRDFALARLARFADADLRAIENDFRRAFPGLDDAGVAAIARASRAGRRTIDAAHTPTDADLARVLAAWLGDLPAWELFRGWEMRLVDERLAGRVSPEAAAQWASLRALLGQPENQRVAAPLILIHDARSDLVGLWRIVLPRPMGYYERAKHLEAARERVEDRIPDRPMALELLERSLRRKDLRERLAGAAFRATRIDYAPPEDAPSEDDPFGRARIMLTLEAPGLPPVVLEREPHSGQTPTELPTQSRPLL